MAGVEWVLCTGDHACRDFVILFVVVPASVERYALPGSDRLGESSGAVMAVCQPPIGVLGVLPVQATAHPVGVEWSPRTLRRARLAAAARRLKSASTLGLPRTRARRPPCLRRMR